jgi:hypothetical protein
MAIWSPIFANKSKICLVRHRVVCRQTEQTEIPKWIGAFDVSIAPQKARNKTIGLSTKVVQNMACEHPVIAGAPRDY